MIVLKMEKEANLSKPLELIISDTSYIYDYSLGEEHKDEFFKLLKNYINFKIRVEYFDSTGHFLYARNHINREVIVKDGIISLDLE